MSLSGKSMKLYCTNVGTTIYVGNTEIIHPSEVPTLVSHQSSNRGGNLLNVLSSRGLCARNWWVVMWCVLLCAKEGAKS